MWQRPLWLQRYFMSANCERNKNDHWLVRRLESFFFFTITVCIASHEEEINFGRRIKICESFQCEAFFIYGAFFAVNLKVIRYSIQMFYFVAGSKAGYAQAIRK
jgi:hypothetical protein